MRLLIVFLLGFVLRAALIFNDPIIFGGDTILRLVDRDQLLKSYQLPLLQVLIAGVSRISMDPALVRYMMAAIGAVAGMAFYLVVADLVGEKWALPATLLFVTNPFLLALATVPYQEMLMVAGLLFAFHYFYNERWLLASLSLALACMTRYEAWAACPVLALAYVLRRDRRAWTWIQAALLFGWMPAIWILFHYGLSEPGEYVIERPLSAWRLQRYLYLSWITAKYTQIPVLLLAMAGAWRLWTRRSRMDGRLWIQIAFLALFLAAILFSAHGVLPDPERYVTAREAVLSICFVSLLAAYGLAQWPRWNFAIVALSVVLGVAGGWWYMRRETSRPELQLAYQLARYLEGSLRDGEHALILARPLVTDDASLYLKKAQETGGEEGLRQARRKLAEVGTPVDYKRVTAYSRLRPDRLLAEPSRCAEWVAVWNDYPEAAKVLAGAEAVEVLRSGAMSVTILRRACDP